MSIEKYNIEKLLAGKRIYDFFSAHYSEKELHSIQNLISGDLYLLPVIDDSNIAAFVIWGYHILDAARNAGLESIYCRNIAGKNYSQLQKLEIALKLEGRTDKYTWPEKEKIYLFIGDIPDTANDSLLYLVQSGSSFMPSAALYSSLPWFIKKMTGNDLLDLKTAKTCSNIPEDGFRLLEKSITGQTFSQRRIFLVCISEIIKRYSMDEKKSCELIERVVSQSDPAAAAGRLRYPELSANEDVFNKFCSTYLKNSGIKLRNPPYFEGDSYSVDFSFSSRKQLDKIIASLETLRDKSDDIFRLL
jgi:hypothetical protein